MWMWMWPLMLSCYVLRMKLTNLAIALRLPPPLPPSTLYFHSRQSNWFAWWRFCWQSKTVSSFPLLPSSSLCLPVAVLSDVSPRRRGFVAETESGGSCPGELSYPHSLPLPGHTVNVWHSVTLATGHCRLSQMTNDSWQADCSYFLYFRIWWWSMPPSSSSSWSFSGSSPVVGTSSEELHFSLSLTAIVTLRLSQ